MQQSPRTQEAERSSPSGYLWVAIGIALVAAGVFLVVRPMGLPFLALGIVLIVLGALTLAGLYMLQPNEAAILLLFGEYVGTDRSEGLRWANPVLQEAEDQPARAQPDERAAEGQRQARQPDRDRRRDRLAGSQHRAGGVRRRGLRRIRADPGRGRGAPPRLARTTTTKTKTSTRTSRRCARARTTSRRRCCANSTDRLDQAGISVEDAKLTHLAYAPEIAQVMLRRQQAEAIIAARSKIVHGRGQHGRDGAQGTVRARHRASRRRTPRGDGVEPARRAVRGKRDAAGHQHRHALPVSGR